MFHHEYAPLKKDGNHRDSSAAMRRNDRKRPSQAKRASKKKLFEKLKS